MGPSYPLGIPCVGFTRKSSLRGHILINPLFTKLVQSKFSDIVFFFFAFLLSWTSPLSLK